MSKFDEQYWVDRLQLQPHPEGGYFAETYRSELKITHQKFGAERNVSTGIYFLLTGSNFSAFHRIKSDEMWHFYFGDPIVIHMIFQNSEYRKITLGQDLEDDQYLQYVVPADCWFASEVAGSGIYGLVGCTVAPGFDFNDFEMAERSKLIELYPEHNDVINRLTR